MSNLMNSCYEPFTSICDHFQYYLMVGVHCLITLLALILLAVFLDDLPKDKLHEEDSLKIQAKRSIMDTLRQLRRRRQLLLTPLNYYTGLCKSFMLADITEVSRLIKTYRFKVKYKITLFQVLRPLSIITIIHLIVNLIYCFFLVII